MQHIAEIISKQLSEKQKDDDDNPKVIKPKNIIFGCTGTIGEKFPEEKIKCIAKSDEKISKIGY